MHFGNVTAIINRQKTGGWRREKKMDYIGEYKTLLHKLLQEHRLSEAQELFLAFRQTMVKYDAELCYLEAVLCYYEGKYPLALFWAEKGKRLDAGYAPLLELFSLLTEGEEQTLPFFDCSFQNRRLRIVIVKGYLEICNYTLERFREVFAALGHEIYLLELERFRQNGKDLLEFVKGGLDFVLTIDNEGMSVRFDETRSLWEFLDVPCLNILFDHPYLFFEALPGLPKVCVPVCMDPYHVLYIKRFFPGFGHSYFMPLGGEELLTGKVIPWELRSIEVLYAGSLKKVADAIDDGFSQKVMRYLAAHTASTAEEAIEICFRSLSREELAASFPVLADGCDPASADDELLRRVIETYRFCDVNTQYIYRKELVKQLIDQGIHVTVYGGGWELLGWDGHPYFHRHSFAPAKECILKMQDAKFVLNVLPWFKAGTHDRIHNGMLAHAICVTDRSAYLEERFTDGEDLLYIALEEVGAVAGRIKALLQNPQQAEKIAESGYQKAVLKETWQNRAMDMLARVMEARFDDEEPC